MSQPWDNPDADPLGDIREFKRYNFQHPRLSGTYVPVTPFFPLEEQVSKSTGFEEHESKLLDSYLPPDKGGQESDGVAIVSGGMDSITLVYYLMKVHVGQTKHAQPYLLSFDYGQRHVKELQFALACAERLGLRWSLIDLSSITDLIASSSLIPGSMEKTVWSKPLAHLGMVAQWEGNANPGPGEEIDVPEGHYAEDNMALTVVPNRNSVMLSIATAVAVSNKYKYVAAGMHAGDHFQYPDCRPKFLASFQKTMMLANEGFIDPNFELLTPFWHSSKNVIAQWAYDLGVPLHETWSCYKGNGIHCGRCGTCVERLEAVHSVRNGDWDQTTYEDPDYWRTALEEYRSQHG